MSISLILWYNLIVKQKPPKENKLMDEIINLFFMTLTASVKIYGLSCPSQTPSAPTKYPSGVNSLLYIEPYGL